MMKFLEYWRVMIELLEDNSERALPYLIAGAAGFLLGLYFLGGLS